METKTEEPCGALSVGPLDISTSGPDQPGDATSEWTLAALAHATVLLAALCALAGGIGVLVGPVALFALTVVQRDRSPYLRFHLLQALAFQSIGLLIYVILVALFGGFVAASWQTTLALSPVLVGLLFVPISIMVTAISVLVLVAVPLIWIAYGLYGAYRVFQGGAFSYWLIGPWLRNEVGF